MPENSVKTGQFVAGKSGNPGGRPKIPEDVKMAFRALAPEAVQTLADIMRHGRKDADRKDASIAILDRAYGKPVQAQDISFDVDTTADVMTQIRRVAMEMANDKSTEMTNDR